MTEDHTYEVRVLESGLLKKHRVFLFLLMKQYTVNVFFTLRFFIFMVPVVEWSNTLDCGSRFRRFEPDQVPRSLNLHSRRVAKDLLFMLQ